MSKQNKKLPVDVQFDYDKLIDMKADQLDHIVKECEINIDRLRGEIVKNYEQAQPYLMQMRILKQQLKKMGEKMEAAKTFLSMEKNGSLVSNLDLAEIKKQVDESPPETPKKESTKFKSPLVANWAGKKSSSTSSLTNPPSKTVKKVVKK
jgi:hypothetical protein